MNRTIKDDSWSIVRNRACIRALIIFTGIAVIQMIAYLITFVTMMVWNVCQKGISDSNQWIDMVDVHNPVFMPVVSIVSSAILIVWCGLKYRRSGWREEHFDYRKAFAWQNVVMIIGIAVGGCIFLSVFLSMLESIFPDMFQSYRNIMNQLVDREQMLTMLYVILVGPIAEEIVFRGAIMDELYLAFPFWLANILQAALFGVFHMNIIQGIYAFLLGIILGAIRLWTGTVFSNILAHILFNFTSFMLPVILGDMLGEKFIGLIALCVSGFVLMMGCRFLWKQIIIKKNAEKTTKR